MAITTAPRLPLAPSPANDGAALLEGRYRFEQLLGRGGMGEVWRARDEQLRREVAIKLVQRRFADHPEYAARFEREARIVARLKHPSIPAVYTSGTAPDGRLYMVMELVPGATLRQKIEREPLDVVAACCVAIQIAEVLDLARGVGIRHRDVKPENIMVKPDGHAWLLDFGIAQGGDAEVGGAGEGGARAKLSGRLGTIGYVPPEQLQGQPVDHRGEQYQLGVTLYEMLTGRFPYDVADGDRTGALGAHAYGIPVPIHRYLPSCPDSMCRVVERLLEKDPELRYATVEELLADLRDVYRESAPPDHAMAPKIEQDRRDQERKRAFARSLAGRSVPPERGEPASASPPEIGRLASLPPESMAPPSTAPPAAVGGGTAPLHAAPASAPRGAGKTEPLDGGRKTLELGAGYVAPSPVHPAARAAAGRSPAVPAAAAQPQAWVAPTAVPVMLPPPIAAAVTQPAAAPQPAAASQPAAAPSSVNRGGSTPVLMVVAVLLVVVGVDVGMRLGPPTMERGEEKRPAPTATPMATAAVEPRGPTTAEPKTTAAPQPTAAAPTATAEPTAAVEPAATAAPTASATAKPGPRKVPVGKAPTFLDAKPAPKKPRAPGRAFGNDNEGLLF